MSTTEAELARARDSRLSWDDVVETGPGTLAGRYLRSFWQPIHRSVDLPSGKAKPIRIMSEDFTLYRGEGGQAHLVAFRCAHRGTQLSTGWVEGDEIRCFYHGWKYDGSGQCTEQPAEPEPFCSRIRIRSYPVQEYLGLIFAYLGEGEPPPLPRYPDFEDEASAAIVTEVTPCNFFNRIDQAADTVHPAFAHRQNGQPIPQLMEAEETDFGITVFAHFPNGTVRTTHFHMPNINEFGGLTRLDLHWRVPIDDASYVTLGVGKFRGEAASRNRSNGNAFATPPGLVGRYGDAVLRGEITVDELAEQTGNGPVVAIQDYVALVGQGAVAPRDADHLGREDVGIALIRALWHRELQAFADGRPTKSWSRPELVVAESGVWR